MVQQLLKNFRRVCFSCGGSYCILHGKLYRISRKSMRDERPGCFFFLPSQTVLYRTKKSMITYYDCILLIQIPWKGPYIFVSCESASPLPSPMAGPSQPDANSAGEFAGVEQLCTFSHIQSMHSFPIILRESFCCVSIDSSARWMMKCIYRIGTSRKGHVTFILHFTHYMKTTTKSTYFGFVDHRFDDIVKGFHCQIGILWSIAIIARKTHGRWYFDM